MHKHPHMHIPCFVTENFLSQVMMGLRLVSSACWLTVSDLVGRSLHQCHKFADGTCFLYLAARVLALFSVATSVPVVYYSPATAVYAAQAQQLLHHY